MADKSAAEMNQELDRYRTALQKMENQWKDAVNRLNGNVLNQKVEELTEQLAANNMELIRLKKETQFLKL
jgi:hypothetical protein